MQELLVVLEDHLVKEFRMLQSLISISKNERVCLRNRDTGQLLRIVANGCRTDDNPGDFKKSWLANRIIFAA